MQKSKFQILEINKIIKSIAAIFGAAMLFSACQKNNVEQIKSFSHPEGAPEMVADSFTLIYSDSSIVRFKLTTPKMLIYEDEKEPYKEFPNGMLVEKFNTDLQIISYLRADYGKHYEKKDLYECKHNVVAINEKGDTLKTNHLFWDEKNERIYSDEYVQIIGKDQILHGTGFESDPQFFDVELTNPQGPIYFDVEEE